MDITIRPALADELSAVGAMTEAAYRADGHIAEGSDYADTLRDAHHRALHTEILVAVDSSTGALLGSVAYVPGGSLYAEVAREDEAEFRMLAVSREARGRGAGEALVLACLDRARAAGASRVVISSATYMATAHRLYERLGFVRLPERDWSPIPGVDLLGLAHEL